ncbi:MAG: hypothetical protein ACI4SR_03050, partial [Faecalibacillus sp.]
MKTKLKLLLAIILIFPILAGCSSHSKTSFSTLVTLDVNPSLSLQLDDDNNVLKTIAYNDDAKLIVEGIDLDNCYIVDAVKNILNSMIQKGYLSKENNTVLLSVESDDKVNEKELEDHLTQNIQNTLQLNSIDSAIYYQDIDFDDDIEKLVKKYDISYGKATLIEEILDDNKTKYQIEDLVKLNAQELILIYQTQHKNDDHLNGQINTEKYISKDQALQIALNDAQLSQSQIENLEIDYDVEHGIFTYEIE